LRKRPAGPARPAMHSHQGRQPRHGKRPVRSSARMERSPSWWRTQPFNAGSRFWRWTTQFGAMSSTTISTAPRTRSAPSRPRRWHAATAHHRPVFNAGKARNEGRQLLLRFEVGHPRVDEIRCHGAGAAGITVNALMPGLVDTPLTRYPKRFSESIGETRPNPPADPSPQEAWNVRAATAQRTCSQWRGSRLKPGSHLIYHREEIKRGGKRLLPVMGGEKAI
jgi:NAD(P)-dependent dehydrogenase (short-subunit alcohol dehydrogenase family)